MRLSAKHAKKMYPFHNGTTQWNCAYKNFMIRDWLLLVPIFSSNSFQGQLLSLHVLDGVFVCEIDHPDREIKSAQQDSVLWKIKT